MACYIIYASVYILHVSTVYRFSLRTQPLRQKIVKLYTGSEFSEFLKKAIRKAFEVLH